jgi:DNA-binding HxlR family transcriptional regulator
MDITNKQLQYDEFLVKVKEGILTESGLCPVTSTLNLLQGKWTFNVLYELCVYDSCRFSTMKKEIEGITNTMLTETLKMLEKEGFVERKQFNEIPPRVEYSFTPKGKDLMPILWSLSNFGLKYFQ